MSNTQEQIKEKIRKAEEERKKIVEDAIARVNFVKLTQRHINDWCDNLPPPEEMKNLREPKYNFFMVQGAAKAGWFDPKIDPETLADMRPADVTVLAMAVARAYAKAEEISPS